MNIGAFHSNFSNAFQSVRVGTPCGRAGTPSCTPSNRYTDTFTISPEARNRLSTQGVATKMDIPKTEGYVPVTEPPFPYLQHELYDANNAVYYSDVLNIRGGVREFSSEVLKPSELQKTLLEENPQLQHKAVSLWGDLTLSMLVGEDGEICQIEINGKVGSILKSNDNTEAKLRWYDGQGLWGTQVDCQFDPSSSISSINRDGVGLFGKGGDSLTSLSKLLGLEGTHKTKESLLPALNKLISKESDDLTKTLGSLIKKAGLGDITKKITFAEDKDGNIVIEGNISAKQKKKLAQIINDDPELVERIKTQKARMEIAEELRKDGQFNKTMTQRNKADFSNRKFDAARTQLLKHFLKENGTSLDEVAEVFANKDQFSSLTDGNNEKLNGLLGLFSDLEGEFTAYKERKVTQAAEEKVRSKIASTLPGGSEKPTSARSLLSMKRGELSEASNEERNFGSELSGLRGIVNKIIDEYNEEYRDSDPSHQITGFHIKIDEKGRLSITDVQTSGDDAIANARAEMAMNHWFAGTGQGARQESAKPGEEAKPPRPLNSRAAADEMVKNERAKNSKSSRLKELVLKAKETAKELGSAILEAHDDEDGDVKKFKHEIVTGGGFSGYQVLSADADKAAMAEMDEITQDIGSALGQFFKNTLGIESPFAVVFGQDGTLSFDKGALSSMESDMVKQVIKDLNAYLATEKAGEDTEGMLSPELTGIGKKFMALKEAQDKIHDKSLLPKEGTRFGM
jgi:hypothetical protein